jgi:hypothetical protein
MCAGYGGPAIVYFALLDRRAEKMYILTAVHLEKGIAS